jgi:two-component system, response regulator YesN
LTQNEINMVQKKETTKETILVIDDDPKVITSLEVGLPEYIFIPGFTGEDGLRILKNNSKIDLVLLDYELPDINGIEVLKKIRKSKNNIGIIFLTINQERRLIIECMENKAHSFVDKPFDFKNLKKKITEILDLTYHKKKTPRIPQEHVKQVKKIVEAEIDNVYLKNLSERFNRSQKYYSRIFKKHTGKTFTQYKVELKIKKAKKLLKESNLTVTQISYDLGYLNPSAFRKTFKKTVGTPPLEYRKKRP